MVAQTIVGIAKKCLAALPQYGIHPVQAVIFGSAAGDRMGEWSDIDILVIAPEFDENHDLRLVEQLWLATEQADDRIEPVACGAEEWKSQNARSIAEIARREGVTIAA